MLQCLHYCSFDIEPRIFNSDSFENRDTYIRSNYKHISERYQGAEEYISYYRISVLIISCTVINDNIILSTFYLYWYISYNC